jgi:hypothetical protein
MARAAALSAPLLPFPPPPQQTHAAASSGRAHDRRTWRCARATAAHPQLWPEQAALARRRAHEILVRRSSSRELGTHDAAPAAARSAAVAPPRAVDLVAPLKQDLAEQRLRMGQARRADLPPPRWAAVAAHRREQLAAPGLASVTREGEGGATAPLMTSDTRSPRCRSARVCRYQSSPSNSAMRRR